MITWRNGTVSGTRREWPGAIELDVSVDGAPEDGGQVRALAYPALTGRPRPGDRVLVNTTALDLGLGTGGYALVVALPDRLPPDPELAGHLVKARYTPLQATVLGADEQGSPHHDVLRDADDIGGMPVVVADLHSALPAVLAGLLTAERSRPDRPGSGQGPTVVYVMQDGGALPAWFSRSCATLREAGWLAATVTTGQSFGGDLETVTVHTGLLAARHVLGADVAVIAQGPGNLGGRPVASLRISDADPRLRHRGVSHHSLTAYGRVALARADVVVPALAGDFGARVAAEAAPLGTRHEVVTVPVDGLEEALRACPARLSTMGRGLEEDLAYFLAAAAAGRHAGRLLRQDPRVSRDGACR
jgi:hypothetical protein